MGGSEQALRALEDVTIYRNVFQGTQDRLAADEVRKDADTMHAASMALRERNGTIQRMKGQLDEVAHNRNYAAVLFIAASKTLDHVVRDFAKAAGVSEDEMRKRYNMIRTQHFNQQVNEGVTRGWFQHDPRADLSEEQRKWYVPGLDSDHGF